MCNLTIACVVSITLPTKKQTKTLIFQIFEQKKRIETTEGILLPSIVAVIKSHKDLRDTIYGFNFVFFNTYVVNYKHNNFKQNCVFFLWCKPGSIPEDGSSNNTIGGFPMSDNPTLNFL